MRYVKARPIPPKIILVFLILAVLLVAGYAWRARKESPPVHDFASCVAAGNPVLESYPEQCVHQGQSFINPAQNVPRPY